MISNIKTMQNQMMMQKSLCIIRCFLVYIPSLELASFDMLQHGNMYSLIKYCLHQTLITYIKKIYPWIWCLCWFTWYDKGICNKKYGIIGMWYKSVSENISSSKYRRENDFAIMIYCLFRFSAEDHDVGLGICGWLLTAISWLLVIVTLPFSLCVCFKVKFPIFHLYV